MKYLLVLTLLTGCPLNVSTQEACSRTCAPQGVREVTETVCTCQSPPVAEACK